MGVQTLAGELNTTGFADGHNYIGHTFIGDNYMGHTYIGHNYMGHDYIGLTYMGHNYIGFADGTGTVAKFNYPCCAAALAATREVLIADTNNFAVRRVTTEGVVTTVAGTMPSPSGSGTQGNQDGSALASTFGRILGIVVDDFTGDFWVSQPHCIRKYTVNTEVDGSSTCRCG